MSVDRIGDQFLPRGHFDDGNFPIPPDIRELIVTVFGKESGEELLMVVSKWPKEKREEIFWEWRNPNLEEGRNFLNMILEIAKDARVEKGS